MERLVIEQRRLAQDNFIMFAFIENKTANFAVRRKTTFANYIPIMFLSQEIDDEMLLEMSVKNGSFEPLSSELKNITQKVWLKAQDYFEAKILAW